MVFSLLGSDRRVGAKSHFAIELDGTIVANFQECSGLSATVQVEKYEEGGWNHTPLKYPGRGDFGNIVLKRGVTESSDLYNWFLLVMAGIWARRLMTVILQAEDRSEIARWEFYAAFPVRWTGPTFDANGAGVTIEEIEIAHEGLIGF